MPLRVSLACGRRQALLMSYNLFFVGAVASYSAFIVSASLESGQIFVFVVQGGILYVECFPTGP